MYLTKHYSGTITTVSDRDSGTIMSSVCSITSQSINVQTCRCIRVDISAYSYHHHHIWNDFYFVCMYGVL